MISDVFVEKFSRLDLRINLNAIIERLKKNGFTDEQIAEILK